jgi:hypothetical protein
VYLQICVCVCGSRQERVLYIYRQVGNDRNLSHDSKRPSATTTSIPGLAVNDRSTMQTPSSKASTAETMPIRALLQHQLDGDRGVHVPSVAQLGPEACLIGALGFAGRLFPTELVQGTA